MRDNVWIWILKLDLNVYSDNLQYAHETRIIGIITFSTRNSTTSTNINYGMMRKMRTLVKIVVMSGFSNGGDDHTTRGYDNNYRDKIIMVMTVKITMMR